MVRGSCTFGSVVAGFSTVPVDASESDDAERGQILVRLLIKFHKIRTEPGYILFWYKECTRSRNFLTPKSNLS